MKIVSVIGARPQFIKCAPVSEALRKNNLEILIHTGQHYDYEMSRLFFDQLKITEPKYNLGIGSLSQGEQTGKMLIELEKILRIEQPDLVIIYGDTNSTLAGALASVKIGIPTGHIEAGLRSFDRQMPEEINRVVADHISNLLFVPTKTAVDNLKNEGISQHVFKVGDVMFDVLKQHIKKAQKSKILENLDIRSKKYFLTTIHRPSNTDNIRNLSNLLDVFSSIDEKIVFPIHPRTKNLIKKHNLEKKIGKNILIIKPVSYYDFIWLEQNAKKILTDSGGVQKEAYMLKVPCITLRENTEWIETIHDGWNILVGANKEEIIDAMNNFQPTRRQKKYFGNGDASRKIVKIIEEYSSGDFSKL